MKKKQLLLIFLIALAGFIAYFGYIYSTKVIDYGLFCGDGFTECYKVVKRWIIIHSTILFILYILFFFLGRKKEKISQESDFWMLMLTFVINVFHWIDINSSWGILAIPLNSFLLFYFLFFKSKIKIYLYISIIFYFLIYLNLIFNISELFYYNQKYSNYENCLYLYSTILLLLFLVLRIKDILTLKK